MRRSQILLQKLGSNKEFSLVLSMLANSKERRTPVLNLQNGKTGVKHTETKSTLRKKSYLLPKLKESELSALWRKFLTPLGSETCKESLKRRGISWMRRFPKSRSLSTKKNVWSKTLPDRLNCTFSDSVTWDIVTIFTRLCWFGRMLFYFTSRCCTDSS